MAQAKRSDGSALADARRPAVSKAADAATRLAPHAPAEVELITDLQRTAGNRAVARFLESEDATLQRVPVSTEFHETLYNKEATSGLATAPPKGFTGKPTDKVNPDKTSYEMTRDNNGVTVLIKIRYLSQSRNTVPPPSPNPTNLPELGALTGTPSEIPVNDPSDRRTWAAGAATKATAHWTGLKISFASIDHPQPGEGAGSYAPPLPPSPIRLPVTFKAEAVFGINEPAHHQVIVHPPSTVPGTPGNPIDKGNWYQQDTDPAKRAAAYPHSDDVIYAHEYGHMLGIPDEYSQSNEQLNALMHQAAPATAASSRASLDKTTIERMTLAALTRRLSGQLQAAMPIMVAALNAKRKAVTRRLALAARAAAVSADVRSVLVSELSAESDARTSPKVPTAVAFQTTKNFSNLDIAGKAVAGGFAIGPVTTLIVDAYKAALAAPHKTNVAVAGFDDVRIKMSSAVFGAAGAATPLAVPAATEATNVVGPAAPGPGLPVVPPGTLIAQLRALPGTWATAGSTLETSVTPAAFSTVMAANLRNVAAGAGLARALALLPGVAGPAQLGSTNALYRRAYTLVSNAAADAAKQVVSDLLSATVKPTLDASVTSLQATINAEVTRITTTPPPGGAVAPPPDPQMAAIVAAMKARLDADKAATAGTGRDPTAGGGTAPDQNVTYSAQGLMGSSNSSAVRVDQFKGMIDAFNDKLRKVPREDVFTVDVGK